MTMTLLMAPDHWLAFSSEERPARPANSMRNGYETTRTRAIYQTTRWITVSRVWTSVRCGTSHCSCPRTILRQPCATSS